MCNYGSYRRYRCNANSRKFWVLEKNSNCETYADCEKITSRKISDFETFADCEKLVLEKSVISKLKIFSKILKFRKKTEDVFEIARVCERNMWFRKLWYFREHKLKSQISKLYNFETYPKVEVTFFLVQERKYWVHKTKSI